MDGYPKTLNTKADYEYVRKNFPKAAWQRDFQNLLDSATDWFNTGKITGNGITDDTHKVVTSPGMGDREAESYQYELRENPEAKIFRVGYTVAEAEKILEEG